jgi:hypothetical protein
VAFDRVVQQAVAHASASSATQVDTGSLLVFMLQETESHAAYFLKTHGVERLKLLRILSHGSVDGAAVLKGVNLVLRLFQTKLERYSVKPFDAKGQPFDPRLHEAISQVPTADVAPGTVATELQKGYRIGDKLLRPAIVAVATAPAAGKPEEQDR